MNFWQRFVASLRRLTPLEAAVINELIRRLPPDDGEAVKLQLRTVYLKREGGGRFLYFSFPGSVPAPAIRRLAETPETLLAIVTVQGKASRFKTTAKVRASQGILCLLEFDLIPWSGREEYRVECQLVGFEPGITDSTETG